MIFDEEAAAKAIEVDPNLYKDLTEENVWEFIGIPIKLEKLDGNYIEEFDRKMREGGIPINDVYLSRLKETGQPVSGIDPRTGVYGIKYAASGFFSVACEYFSMDDYDNALANSAKAVELQPRHL